MAQSWRYVALEGVQGDKRIRLRAFYCVRLHIPHLVLLKFVEGKLAGSGYEKESHCFFLHFDKVQVCCAGVSIQRCARAVILVKSRDAGCNCR